MVELLSLPKPIKIKELVTDINIASSCQLIWGQANGIPMAFAAFAGALGHMRGRMEGTREVLTSDK